MKSSRGSSGRRLHVAAVRDHHPAGGLRARAAALARLLETITEAPRSAQLTAVEHAGDPAADDDDVGLVVPALVAEDLEDRRRGGGGAYWNTFTHCTVIGFV